MNRKHAIGNADQVDIILSARNARAQWFKDFAGSLASAGISRYRAKPNPLIMQGLHIS